LALIGLAIHHACNLVYAWFDQTRAVSPFETKALEEMPDTYPFGL
jgi:hypothetical protein